MSSLHAPAANRLDSAFILVHSAFALFDATVLAQLVDAVPEWAYRAAPYALAAVFGWPLLLLPYAVWREIRIRRQRRREFRGRKGLCPDCGYDLTGNASGVCPECGRGSR